MPFYKVNKTWTDEKNNITYYDGSTFFQIIKLNNLLFNFNIFDRYICNRSLL